MHDLVIHGASSFIGRHFCRRLISEEIPFTVIARKKTDLTFLEQAKHVHIFRYLISPSEINTSRLSVTNAVFLEFSWHGVFGTERNNPEQFTVNIPLILDSVQLAHRLNAVHWIGFGSQAEYGNLNKKIDETDLCQPTTLYGKAKLASGILSHDLCNSYGMHHSWLRLFSVYGPDDNHEWLIPYLIKKMLADEIIDVTKGEQTWDYLYVDDISDMLLRLIPTTGCGIANLASGNSETVKNIVLLLKKITGTSSEINFGTVPYRIDQVMIMEAYITKLQSVTGWFAKTDLETGLKATTTSLKNKVVH